MHIQGILQVVNFESFHGDNVSEVFQYRRYILLYLERVHVSSELKSFACKVAILRVKRGIAYLILYIKHIPL